MEEFVGAIVLEVDGQEIEVVDMSTTTKTGRKLVKTMTRSGRARGYSEGITEHDLSITAVIPSTGDIDWESITNAKLTVFPVKAGGQRVSYRDCFVTEVGEKYSVDNEARRDIKMHALDKVTE